MPIFSAWMDTKILFSSKLLSRAWRVAWGILKTDPGPRPGQYLLAYLHFMIRPVSQSVRACGVTSLCIQCQASFFLSCVRHITLE